MGAKNQKELRKIKRRPQMAMVSLVAIDEPKFCMISNRPCQLVVKRILCKKDIGYVRYTGIDLLNYRQHTMDIYPDRLDSFYIPVQFTFWEVADIDKYKYI